MLKVFFFLSAILVSLTLIRCDETTENLADVDDVDPDPSKPGNYRLIVHLHRPLRLNVFGKRVDGKLTIKVNAGGVDSSQTINLKEGLVGNMLIKRTKMDISGKLDETSTVDVSFSGVGDGVLQVTRVSLIPSDGGTAIEKAKNSLCAVFKGSNLLELEGSIKKTLSRRACIGIIGGK